MGVEGRSKTLQNMVNQKKVVSFKNRERRGFQVNTTVIHTSIHNSILIWCQYLLESIDRIMFYSVTRLSQMNFLL